jgi:DNA-binding transcriptional regulator YiaG
MTNLREIIAGLGLTQTGAARLIGVEPRTMRRWVEGRQPVPEPARRLLKVLDLPQVRQRLDAVETHVSPS